VNYPRPGEPSSGRCGGTGVRSVMDPYAVLGVARDSDRRVIREAYLALARRHHPDQVGAEPPAVRARADARMREINEAWTILGHADRRAAHDRQWVEGDRPPAPGVVRPRPSTSAWHPRADDTGWMDDFASWRAATDDLLAPDDDQAEARPLLMVLPVLLAVASLGLGCLGLVLDARPLLAGAIGGLVCAVVAFFVLPIVVMTAQRGARRR